MEAPPEKFVTSDGLPFVQCVDFKVMYTENRKRMYAISSMVLMYFVPLVVMTTAYTLIFITISKKSREHSGNDALP